MKQIIATILFFTAFIMMFVPLIVLAIGVEPHVLHVVIGVIGLILSFVFPMLGFYGEEL